MSKKRKRQSRSSTLPVSRKEEFNPDYSLVVRDLKRIGFLAGLFVLILIVLSFFQDGLLTLFIK